MNNEPTTPAGGGVGEPYSSDLWEGFNLDAPPPETPFGGVLHADFAGHTPAPPTERTRPLLRSSREGNAVPKESTQQDGKRKNYPVHTQFEIVMDWLKDCRLVCAEGTAFAVVPVDGKPQPIEIDNREFQDYLSILAEDRNLILKPQAKAMIADSMGALARQRGDAAKIFLRIGGKSDAGEEGRTYETIYVDLGDRAHRLVEIDRNGWRVLEGEPASDVPIMFRRPSAMHALPVPVRVPEDERSGVWNEFEKLMRPSGMENWVKIIGWLLNAFRAPTSGYMGICITGPQNSGKSVRSRFLRNVIDPSRIGLTGEITEKRDFPAIVQGSFVLGLTNLSSLPQWCSDALCRLATDGTMVMRELNTTAEPKTIDALRPMLLNGITDFVKRPDLKRRLLFVELPPLEGKKTPEKVLNQQFKSLHPRLLGVIFDAIVASLHHIHDEDIEDLDWGEGDADFGGMVAAAEKGGALPWKSVGTFMDVYSEGMKETAHGVLAGDTVAQAIIGLIEDMEERGETPSWRGPAAMLHPKIATIAAWQSLDREEVLKSEIRTDRREVEYFFTDTQRIELRNVSIMRIRERLPEHIRAKWEEKGRRNLTADAWLNSKTIGGAIKRIQDALKSGAKIEACQPKKSATCHNTDWLVRRIVVDDTIFDDE